MKSQFQYTVGLEIRINELETIYLIRVLKWLYLENEINDAHIKINGGYPKADNNVHLPQAEWQYLTKTNVPVIFLDVFEQTGHPRFPPTTLLTSKLRSATRS